MQTRTAISKTAAFVCALSALLGAPQALHAFPVQLADAPTNQLEMTLATIRSARKSLFINIYEMTEKAIADAIEERIRAGVHVELLLEGQPVGGRKTASLAIQSQLIQAMRRAKSSGNRFFEMTSHTERGVRRFRYNHAKYILVDGTSLLVSSENFTPGGNPQPGTLGNRGWEIRVYQAQIARQYFQMFRQDTDVRYGDVISWVTEGTKTAFCGAVSLLCPSAPGDEQQPELFGFRLQDFYDLAPPAEDPSNGEEDAFQPGAFAAWGRAVPAVDATAVQKVTSPDSSLEGLVQMIRSARSLIEVQQMNFYVDWKNAETQSPLLTELIAAARRGVVVRVLLNDDAYFAPPGSADQTKNKIMVRALNQLAQSRRLNLAAKIADLKGMGVSTIHNKGAIIDREKVLISSINWNENSVTRNREAALLLTSRDAAAYYGRLFDFDWRVSRDAIPPSGGGYKGPGEALIDLDP